MSIRMGAVALDCEEPGPLARFWASLLDGDVVVELSSFAAVKVPGLWITAHRVENHRSATWPDDDVPKQVHLDLAVDDLKATSERAVELGARLADVQPAADRYLVLFDPAGHPFCLTTQIPD
ncbi:MAG: VOC family protein [Acidobacteriota bacterium]|nr:VOC family protein [Acidobacteriota bacterium]